MGIVVSSNGYFKDFNLNKIISSWRKFAILGIILGKIYLIDTVPLKFLNIF